MTSKGDSCEKLFNEDFSSNLFPFLSAPVFWKWLFWASITQELSHMASQESACAPKWLALTQGSLGRVSGHTLLEAHVAQPDKRYFLHWRTMDKTLLICAYLWEIGRARQDFSFRNTAIGNEDQDILKH